MSTEANFKKATGILSADMKWTPMNETGSVRPEECKPSDRVKGFKLNRILFKAEGSRKYVSTHGDMINGEDARFDYSLYERTLGKGFGMVLFAWKKRQTDICYSSFQQVGNA